jgi:hypothetical protein
MDYAILAKIISPLITAIAGALIKKYAEAKPKLLNYLIHASAIPLNDQAGTTVNTHSVVVRNSGKKTAHNVRMGHNYLPQGFQVFPRVQYEVVKSDNGAAEIIIPNLVPNEQVTISYLYFPPTAWTSINSYCKCDEAMAEYINVVPTKQLNKAQYYALSALVFLGAAGLVYFVLFSSLSYLGLI